MRFFLGLTLIAAVAVATPTAEPAASEFHELEARAARSQAGWYSYGCYVDCIDGMGRQLPVLAYKESENSPDKCIAACIGLGKSVAGLQFGDECWCGDNAGTQTRAAECDVRCDGLKKKCGGGCRNNVWASAKKN